MKYNSHIISQVERAKCIVCTSNCISNYKDIKQWVMIWKYVKSAMYQTYYLDKGMSREPQGWGEHSVQSAIGANDFENCATNINNFLRLEVQIR